MILKTSNIRSLTFSACKGTNYSSKTVRFTLFCANTNEKRDTQDWHLSRGVFKDSIKHDFCSPCYTTRWSDIPEAA